MKAKLDSNSVKDTFIALLQDHPDIFAQYPELIGLINLPDDRGTASLLEYQIKALKQQIHKTNKEHTELLHVARENEQITDNFGQITELLLGLDSLPNFIQELPSALRSTFNIDEVCVKTKQDMTSEEQENNFAEAVRRLGAKQSVCDNRWPRSILSLFFSEQIKSAALIPMLLPNTNTKQTKLIGILALGSNDAERYNNDLGTSHLNRLGVMSGICMARLQKLK